LKPGGDRRLRVLLVTPLPPPFGGISAWTERVLGGPLGERFDIEVVDTSPPEKVAVSGESRFRARRAGASLWMLFRFMRALRRHRPDVVHVNTSYGWALARDGFFIRMANRAGIPSVFHFHGGDLPESIENSPSYLQAPIKKTLRQTSALVALTRHTHDYLEACVGVGRVHTLPNFVEMGAFRAMTRDTRRDALPEVLFVGWILEAKGARELLAAAHALPGARFTLIGQIEPEFRATLSADLEALSDRVTLLPPRPFSEVLPLYERADLFVLPTWREGFPIVVIEAMAAGLPVVSTPVGAIPEIVREGIDGLLVPPRDAQALTQALAVLLGDPERRREMGLAGRERVKAHFTQEIVMAELETLWCEVARGS